MNKDEIYIKFIIGVDHITSKKTVKFRTYQYLTRKSLTGTRSLTYWVCYSLVYNKNRTCICDDFYHKQENKKNKIISELEKGNYGY